ILGHTQQGGRPSPFDRIQAIRLAAVALERLVTLAESGAHESTAIGRENGKLKFNDLRDMPALVEPKLHRPKVQRWMALRGLERKMAEHDPPRRDKP
ncbi:MAG: hypothetical protein KDD75_12665, partial [Caldilineaceae bacterium]|nr:hypothetical protein [Caldilineaceae bacterium]